MPFMVVILMVAIYNGSYINTFMETKQALLL